MRYLPAAHFSLPPQTRQGPMSAVPSTQAHLLAKSGTLAGRGRGVPPPPRRVKSSHTSGLVPPGAMTKEQLIAAIGATTADTGKLAASSPPTRVRMVTGTTVNSTAGSGLD